MGLFEKMPAVDKEWEKVLKQEKKFLEKRLEKKESILNQKLAEKIPKKLQDTLDTAFYKAFSMIFEKGTAVIEKTYNRETLEQDYKVQQYAVEIKQNKKAFRTLTQNASYSGVKNVATSSLMGIVMGALGIGLPDIPLFTGMIFKSIYEIALRYGYEYETQEEQIYILLLIQGALSYGEDLRELNEEINTYIATQQFSKSEDKEEELRNAAAALSKELLYMKFLQGIPIIGVVGGAYDAVYMQRITEYVELKYRHRYLYDEKKRELKGK